MGLIRQIQSEHKTWLEHNFPDQTPLDGFLGMVEEMGEMSHAILKYKQGIRGHVAGDADQYTDDLADALGDLFIFMCSFCNSNHLNLEDIVLLTWERVKHRDWQADPEMGGE
jgi:NTP pyrophosphatase (non-canonical NTP hydrolase)